MPPIWCWASARVNYNLEIEVRVRNRTMDVLELIVDSKDCPFSLADIINFWFDWVPEDRDVCSLSTQVYTQLEIRALSILNARINTFCDETPKTLTQKHAQLEEWNAVVVSAIVAFEEFNKRGKLEESDEL